MSNFFTLDRWTRLVDLVCVMKCDPAHSIEREYANQLTRKRGTIMTENTLKHLNAAIDETVAKYGPKFKKTFNIDTSTTNAREGATAIARETLEVLRDFLDESLCVLRKSSSPITLPSKGFIFDSKEAQAFVDAIISSKEFVPRSKAEYDSEYLIPIPCALIIFNGRVLILKRKEEGHALHDTYAIWAGGHVMQSDDDHSNIIIRCLRRELMEELYIEGEYELKPVGLVRTDQDERASRHIGIVYTARLRDDRVALSLDQKEFRERRGTSVSGTLLDINRLQEYFGQMGDWSKFIVEAMWPKQSVLLPRRGKAGDQPALDLK